MINISYIKLKKNVVDDYKSTKSGWNNKMVNWDDLSKVMCNSRIQYSCYSWRNGVKTYDNFSRELQDCIILDVDDGVSIVNVQKMLKKYHYALATTKSHLKSKKGLVVDRFRVLIKAINIPTDDEVYFRTMELMFPFSDKQVLTKTASFLGTTDSIYISNDGKSLDLHKASLLAEQQLKEERVERKVIDKDLIPNYGGTKLDDIKEQLTFEVIVDVLESVGYEVIGNKFKLREDERTNSANINYKNLLIKDYGSDYFGDIFDVLVEYQEMKFGEAIRYVRNFI